MRTVSLFACILLAAPVAAIAQDHEHAEASSASTSGPPRTPAPAGVEVYFISPANGATVGQDVKVLFGLKGMGVAPAGVVHDKTGHHHLLIDVDELPPGNLPIPADAQHVHFGGGQTQATIHLEPGTHTLQLDLGDALHMQFDPPIVSKKITVHVK